MPITKLLSDLTTLKITRRIVPSERSLQGVTDFAASAHALLAASAQVRSVPWRGSGIKDYVVYTEPAATTRWSRAVNTELYVSDVTDFATLVSALSAAVLQSAGTGALSGLSPSEVDRALYTAVMSWAAVVDIFQPSNGLAGTYFEMVIGPIIAILSGRPETGAVGIEVGGGEDPESVKVDITYHASDQSLAVPTKISTRERVSQPYVHAAILESAFPGRYRTALCIGNETNMFQPSQPAARRGLETLTLGETLVPGTIALYQKYIAQLSGLYYLDVPTRYITNTPPGFPHVATMGEMLTRELPHLLSRP